MLTEIFDKSITLCRGDQTTTAGDEALIIVSLFLIYSFATTFFIATVGGLIYCGANSDFSWWQISTPVLAGLTGISWGGRGMMIDARRRPGKSKIFDMAAALTLVIWIVFIVAFLVAYLGPAFFLTSSSPASVANAWFFSLFKDTAALLSTFFLAFITATALLALAIEFRNRKQTIAKADQTEAVP